MVKQIKKIQNELMVEIFFRSLVRAIGKVLCMKFKARFHETTKFDKMNQRCIQIDQWVMLTCRHRPMAIGAVLADDQRSYFIFGRQEMCCFWVKV